MTSKTYYTPEEIIAKGEELSAEAGTPVEPWEIHKALGKLGNYKRVEKIWLGHLASKAGVQTRAEAPAALELPEALAMGLETALAGAATAIRALFAGERERAIAAHGRHMDDADRRSAGERAALSRQLEYWRDQAADAAEVQSKAEEERDAALAERDAALSGRDEALVELEGARAERDRLRRELEAANALLAARHMQLPVGGETTPLVSPARKPPEAPKDHPELLSARYRRGRGRSEAAALGAQVPEGTALDQQLALSSHPDALPGQLDMPF